MVTTSSKPITLKEFLALPETNLRTQKTLLQKSRTQLRCTFGGRSTVTDVTIFTWDRIPRDDNGEIADSFQAAPDWTMKFYLPNKAKLE